MDDKIIVTLIGLLFDIAGVVALFCSTSRKRIENEMYAELLRRTGHRLNLPPEVERNRRLQRWALLLIIFGFGLQATGLFV